MNTKPILFQGDMVRAILEGRKTQTRRIVKGVDGKNWIKCVDETGRRFGNHVVDEKSLCMCPYGQPGDLLWCRETWMPDAPRDGSWPDVEFYGCGMSPLSHLPARYRSTRHCIYRATWAGGDMVGWTPSIHMPRWASRLTLEVTDVRVERVQEISQEDALAEGIQWSDWLEGCHTEEGRYFHCSEPRECFLMLWDSINEPRGYGRDANPWVWVIEFRAIEANVNDVLANPVQYGIREET